jgi:hypothetical protein
MNWLVAAQAKMVAVNGYFKLDLLLKDKYNCVNANAKRVSKHREAHEELTLFRLAIRRLL